MKLKSMILIVMSITFLLIGCSKKEAMLPEGIPDFVKDSDFEKIDWSNKATTFNNDMVGHKNKSWILADDMSDINKAHKWMWHLWGVDNSAETKLTVVGYHKDTDSVHKILTYDWSLDLAGENNGADAHIPSSVNFTEAGEWDDFTLYR